MCEIWSRKVNIANGFVICPGTQRTEEDIKFRGRMEVVALDDTLYCKTDPSKVDDNGNNRNKAMKFGAVKLDVEGFEWQAIEGGMKFFQENRIPFIVYEVNLIQNLIAFHVPDMHIMRVFMCLSTYV